MRRVLGFYRTFIQTINPNSYEGFAESITKNTFSYYASLILNAFVIMLILLIPILFQLPNTVESYFDNVETMNFNIDFKTSSPIMIPDKNPLLIINYADEIPTTPAKVILNNNVLYFGALFSKYVKDFSTYKDAKASKNAVSNIIAVALLLMLPTLLLIFFFYIYIKYFAIVLIATAASLLAAQVMKYRVKAKRLFNCAVYGISLTLFLDIIFFAFDIRFYYIQFIPLVIYCFYGIILSGEKVDPKMKGKFLEVKG